MMKLTDERGDTIWVSPPHIRCIRAVMVGKRHGSLLEYTDGDTVKVTDPPGNVAQMFAQWFGTCSSSRRHRPLRREPRQNEDELCAASCFLILPRDERSVRKRRGCAFFGASAMRFGPVCGCS
jgi:hypothetical protein